jgi:uncharacterized membrane protein
MILRLAVTITLLFSCTPQAWAQLTACNSGTAVQSLAIVFDDGTTYRSMGWFTIEPGQRAVLIKHPIVPNSNVYYSFQDDPADGTTERRFCVNLTQQFSVATSASCPDDFTPRVFRHADTGGASRHEILISDSKGLSPNPCPPLPPPTGKKPY